MGMSLYINGDKTALLKGIRLFAELRENKLNIKTSHTSKEAVLGQLYEVSRIEYLSQVTLIRTKEEVNICLHQAKLFDEFGRELHAHAYDAYIHTSQPLVVENLLQNYPLEVEKKYRIGTLVAGMDNRYITLEDYPDIDVNFIFFRYVNA